jgi:urease accessory protein
MIIKEKGGNLGSRATANKTIDWVDLEWHEVNKRIMHKHSRGGAEVIIKFMSERQQLAQDDILFEEDDTIYAVNISPCEVLLITPGNMYEMACICYEIGNRHIPLFYEGDTLLVAQDLPLLRWLTASNYQVTIVNKKLTCNIKTTVIPDLLLSRETKITTQ